MMGYSYGKLNSYQGSAFSYAHMIQAGPSPYLFQSILAGPARGLAADINVLNVFTLYDRISHHTIPDKQLDIAWQHLSTHLQTASNFDPYFWDTYRLTAGLLAFHKGSADDAVKLMEKGSQYRSWDWETPFIAGFIAHSILKDDQLAARLMKTSATRPDAPSLAFGLAARFLNKTTGENEAIQFLQYMKTVLPRDWHKAIDRRLKRLKQENRSDAK
ncbi:hypothetical protein ACFL4I_00385 [Pseudomonadota bacterium]